MSANLTPEQYPFEASLLRGYSIQGVEVFDHLGRLWRGFETHAEAVAAVAEFRAVPVDQRPPILREGERLQEALRAGKYLRSKGEERALVIGFDSVAKLQAAHEAMARFISAPPEPQA